MTYRSALFFLSLLFLCPLVTQGDEQITNEQKVDALFTDLSRPDSPAAVVVIVRDGKTIFQKSYGLANIEYEIPADSTTLFHIASVSKQFTAYCIATLLAEGAISLDDDVRTYVPEVPDFGEHITIKNLLHHNSGLRDQWALLGMTGVRLDDVITRKQLLKLVSRQKALNFKPGENIMYSNTGYMLLAELVSRVSGMSFPDYVRQHVFEPLGMDDSFVNDSHKRIIKNRAYPYLWKDETSFEKGVLSYGNYGATSVFTTADDIALWLINFGKQTIGNPQVYAYFLSPGEKPIVDDTTYGFGLVHTTYRGATVYTHSGFDAGFMSVMAYYPDFNFGVAVLANYPFASYKAADGLTDIFIGDLLQPVEENEETAESPGEKTEDEAPAVPVDVLQQYAGEYYCEELGQTYDLQIDEDHLLMRHWRNEDVVLKHQEKDIFSGDAWWANRLEFTRDEAGKVDGILLSNGRAVNVRFTRR